MYRLARNVVGWVAATTIATGVSWVAIQNLVTTAALSQPAPVAAAAVPTDTPTAVAAVSTTPAATATRPTPKPTPKATRTRSKATTTPVESAPESSSTPDSEPSEAATVKGYSLKGGQVVLELSPDSAELVSAVPAAGYQTETWKSEYWFRVDFAGDEGRSSLMVSWYQQAPVVQETEF